MTKKQRNPMLPAPIYVHGIQSGIVYPARIRSWCYVPKGRCMGKRVSYSVVVYGEGFDHFVAITGGQFSIFRFVYTKDLIKMLKLVENSNGS